MSFLRGFGLLADSAPSVRLKTAVAPRRLEILELVWDRELAVNDIAAQLPVSLAAVSQHLAKLREAGLVSVRAEGRRRFYRAAHDSMGGVAELLRPILGDPPRPTAVDEAPQRPRDSVVTSSDLASSPSEHESSSREDSAVPHDQPVATAPAPSAAPAISTPTKAGLPGHSDEMASWYRQGLRARIVALQASKQALADGVEDAAESIRRIASTLTRAAIAERFPDVATTALAIHDVALEGDDDVLDARVDRLIGALKREIAPDDERVATILIVEDSRVEAALHRSIVSGPNREVLVAGTAEEAQSILDSQSVDLIILDLGLPGEDGRDLLVRLGRRPHTAAIPVILLTGKTDVRTRTEVLSLGADAFYTKPADAALLSASVAMMLERAAETRYAGRQDPLTGLKNRSVFVSEVRPIASAAMRTGMDLSLAIIDVDRLAAVNDFHGSESGDLVLRHVANRLRSTFRESDYVARWGGGKFAVLFTNSDERGGALALQKLLAGDGPVTLSDGTELTPTWHAGVASVGGEGRIGLDDAIARATRRLQVAAGRSEDPIVATDEAIGTDTRNILLIDDDEILGDLIEHRLRREGFEVTRFSDGAEALAAMAEVTASAVVLDTMLPGADGFEVLRTLRASPSFAGIPVVVLTFGSDHDTRRAFELGASDALAKPFSVKELVTRVSRLVEQLEKGVVRG